LQLKPESSGIVHVVLFKWKAEALAEEIGAAVEGLRGLPALLPEILELTVGENFTERSQGFTHGLVVRFADRAGLESYGPSEAHQRVVKNLITPIRADVLAVDYEV
jgi:hypothetical protein